MEKLKCLVMGAPVSGKTSLINTFMTDSFNGYIPESVLASYDVNFIVKPDFLKQEENLLDKSLIPSKEKNFFFKIYDYKLDESIEAQCLNAHELEHVDVILMCYQNFSKASKKYLIEHCSDYVKKKWPNTPIVLISCFSDLLKAFSAKTENISFLEFETSESIESILPIDQDLIDSIAPQKHFHCSALENFNIRKVFIESFKQAIVNKLNSQYLIYQENINTQVKAKSLPTRSDFKVELNHAFKANKIKEVSFFSEKYPQNVLAEHLENQIQLTPNSKLGKALTRLFISIIVLGCVLVYAFTYQYCNRNRNHCHEIYELSRDALDESIHSLNESYIHLVQQIHQFSTKNN